MTSQDIPMTSTVETAPRIGLAALWMIGAIIAFSAMAVAGRAVSSTHDTFEIMTYRSIVGLVVVLAIASATGTLQQIRRRHLGLHIARNITHFTGQNLWFYAITVIPLAQVFAMEFTSPLWVMILAALFLGERLTGLKVLSGAIGFIGILIVVQPFSAPLSPGMIMAALAAVSFAATAILTKRLTRTENITTIMFWLTAIQLVLGLAICLFDGEIQPPTASSLPWLALIGIAGLAAHFCMTTALSLAPASIVMPIDFVRLPAIAVIGMIFYNEALQPGVFLGAVLIFGANYLNILGQRRTSASPVAKL